VGTGPVVLAAHHARALPDSPPSNVPKAQGRPGAGRAPTVHCAKGGYRNLHSGIQVKPNIRPSLRSGLTAYVALSPGSDALLPPSPCRWLTRPPGRAARITARLGAQTPGARTTRFCRTLAAPVVCTTVFAHGFPPCEPVAPALPASTAAHPACRDDRDNAPRPGVGWPEHAIIPNSCKANYFDPDALTLIRRVLPVGQRKGWCG